MFLDLRDLEGLAFFLNLNNINFPQELTKIGIPNKLNRDAKVGHLTRINGGEETESFTYIRSLFRNCLPKEPVGATELLALEQQETDLRKAIDLSKETKVKIIATEAVSNNQNKIFVLELTYNKINRQLLDISYKNWEGCYVLHS